MPPPLLIPAPRAATTSSTSLAPTSTALVVESQLKPTSTVKRNAGFKPIGQSNAAVRKFFPGDDEDDDEESRETSVQAADSKTIESSNPPGQQSSGSHFVRATVTDQPRQNAGHPAF